MAKFETVSSHLPGDDESHKIPELGLPVSRPRFEPITPGMHISPYHLSQLVLRKRCGMNRQRGGNTHAYIRFPILAL